MFLYSLSYLIFMTTQTREVLWFSLFKVNKQRLQEDRGNALYHKMKKEQYHDFNSDLTDSKTYA